MIDLSNSFISTIKGLFPSDAEISLTAKLIVGSEQLAGSNRPLLSSCAEITVNNEKLLIPFADVNSQANLTCIFLDGGQRSVMPVIRLCRTEKLEISKVEYLDFSEWLGDAFNRWTFALNDDRQASDGEKRRVTVSEHLKEVHWDTRSRLELIGHVVSYAIHGIDWAGIRFIKARFGLKFPRRNQWLRPVIGTRLGRASAGALVITAKAEGDEVPSTNVSAEKYRFRADQECDHGLDMMHTPDGADIRLTGRVGESFRIENRELVTALGDTLALSVSTIQIPFSGHNDPRRNLMGANSQVHAESLACPEPPVVCTTLLDEEFRPDGVNLRIGYLAWKGFNHEDAWVLSQAAADKLSAIRRHIVRIAIRSLEIPPTLCVQVGDDVSKGELLVKRFFAPSLLTTSLEQLGKSKEFGFVVPVPPESSDVCSADAQVVSIEDWDLVSGKGVPDNVYVSFQTRRRFRQLITIVLAEKVPLRVGDKLANRHGHKGIVGAILPNDDMPIANGCFLEALIDPISVLNRSNWGQVFEAKTVGCISTGSRVVVSRTATMEQVAEVVKAAGLILPPKSGDWLSNPVSGMVGTQFVMRMPHYADKVYSVRNIGGHTSAEVRRQRFGEMEHWATWAHSENNTLCDARPNVHVENFAVLLASGGFSFEQCPKTKSFLIRRKRLFGKLPKGSVAIDPDEHKSLTSLYEEIDRERQGQAVLRIWAGYKFLNDNASKNDDERGGSKKPMPLGDVELAGTPGSELPRDTISWLPLVPHRLRRAFKSASNWSNEHALTTAIRSVAKSSYYCAKGKVEGEKQVTADELKRRLKQDVERYLKLAYAHAVGRRATGEGSVKASMLRRNVMGRRLSASVRATIAPGGDLGFELDEIGIPFSAAQTLLTTDSSDRSVVEEMLRKRRVWLKRDPVLHKWGLLSVRARLIDGDVIRLPASLLGPLCADYDGDTVAVFADNPVARGQAERLAQPAEQLWDANLDRAMFVFGKQYLYGLGLILESPELLASLNKELKAFDGIELNLENDVNDAIEKWHRSMSMASERSSKLWAVLETHALCAVAVNPGMGIEPLSAATLRELPVVRMGAAKKSIFEDSNVDSKDALLGMILSGDSMKIYVARCCKKQDPILNVMVDAKVAVGRFGGLLRRILYSLDSISPDLVRHAQSLTEQATQRSLSVKASGSPLKFEELDKRVKELLEGRESVDCADRDVQDLLDRARASCDAIRGASISAIRPAWIAFLKDSKRLGELVDKADNKKLILPTNDMRTAYWLA